MSDAFNELAALVEESGGRITLDFQSDINRPCFSCGTKGKPRGLHQVGAGNQIVAFRPFCPDCVDVAPKLRVADIQEKTHAYTLELLCRTYERTQRAEAKVAKLRAVLEKLRVEIEWPGHCGIDIDGVPLPDLCREDYDDPDEEDVECACCTKLRWIDDVMRETE